MSHAGKVGGLTRSELERRVLRVAEEQSQHEASLSSRLLQDLQLDSLGLVEFVMALEDDFDVKIPDEALQEVFSNRKPVRVSDMVELVQQRLGAGAADRMWWRRPTEAIPPTRCFPFTQFDDSAAFRRKGSPKFDPQVADFPAPQYRRGVDGMRCVLVPAAEVELGEEPLTGAEAAPENPPRRVKLDAFLIDAEPVSTTAFCRFLNAVAPPEETLRDWFLLDSADSRRSHEVIQSRSYGRWAPLPGLEKRPMVLVSWYGANAYSLWSNGRDWKRYRAENGEAGESFLPTEAQWEYAARGAQRRTYPWGEGEPSLLRMQFGLHRRGAAYTPSSTPIADVNAWLGMSPFGLHHMAGNVWNWCRDWHDPAFPQSEAALQADPCNETPTGIRSERGGSWIGPASLCRSAYRRGRPPLVRGRCLGFRCVSRVDELS